MRKYINGLNAFVEGDRRADTVDAVENKGAIELNLDLIGFVPLEMMFHFFHFLFDFVAFLIHDLLFVLEFFLLVFLTLLIIFFQLLNLLPIQIFNLPVLIYSVHHLHK